MGKKKSPTKPPVAQDEKVNDMSQLIDNLTTSGFPFLGGGAPLSQSNPSFYNNRWYIISNDRQLISELYVEHGLVQVFVDQPVDDGFRAGFEIKSSQLDANNIEQIKHYFEEKNVLYAITQALKWTRLYGGGGVLVLTPMPEGKPDTPFVMEELRPDTPIEFIPTDMWELYQDKINIQGDLAVINPEDDYYHYYGKRIHKSRLSILKGKEAPSFVKPRLRGWGMSVLEPIQRSFNLFLKNQNVIYELMDEAKVDIYRMEGFNSALANATGTTKVSKRIQMANELKNYNHALLMDNKDEYDQKVMNFAGLDLMLAQIRTGIAADLKMPMTKLFGMSAAGFNSGEDDIENYNSMIEGEIRSKAKHVCMMMTNIACQQLFGFVPEDLEIIFPPLRILSAKEEEEVKEKQFARVFQAFQAGLISPEDAKRMLNADSLLGAEIDETDETFELETEASEDEPTPQLDNPNQKDKP